MDTGIQLGRRFRSLKLWFILRYFGAEGMRSRIAEHLRLAQGPRRMGRRGPGVRATRAGADERGLLSRQAGGARG